MVVIKMQSKSGVPLESLSRSLPRAVLYQRFSLSSERLKNDFLKKAIRRQFLQQAAPAVFADRHRFLTGVVAAE